MSSEQIPSSPFPTAQEVKPKRGLHVASLFVVVFYLFLPVCLFGYGIYKGSPDMIGASVGYLLLFCIPLGAGLIVWRIWKSNLAYNLVVVFGVFALFCANFGAAINRANKKQSQQRLENLDRKGKSLTREILVAMDKGEDIDQEKIDRYALEMRAAARNASGQDKILLETMTSIMTEFRALGARRDEAMEKFGNAGGIDPSTLKTMDDMDERIRLIDDTINCQDAIIKYGYADRIISEAAARGANAESMRTLKEKVSSNPQVQFQATNNELELTLLRKFREILALLRANHETWSYDTSEEMLVIDDDNVMDQLDKLEAAADAIANEQETLLDKMINSKP